MNPYVYIRLHGGKSQKFRPENIATVDSAVRKSLSRHGLSANLSKLNTMSESEFITIDSTVL